MNFFTHFKRSPYIFFNKSYAKKSKLYVGQRVMFQWKIYAGVKLKKITGKL